jgi:hypothetical protein
MTNDFTAVPNKLLMDNSISAKAKVCYILLKEFLPSEMEGKYIEFLKSEMKEGDFAIRKACNELKDKNYIKTFRYGSSKSGQWRIEGLCVCPMLEKNSIQILASKIKKIEEGGGKVLEDK